MMENFQYYAPTKVVFGKGTENKAGQLVKEQNCRKVLIHYGSGSVKRSGLLDRIFASLDEEGISYISLGGVVPNPRLSLTIAAAGSEMSDSSVITNENGWLKRGYNSSYCRPKFAVMNPELTMTLPKYQTASGCVDIMMHTMERYFNHCDNMELTDGISEHLLRTVMKNAKILMDEPQCYKARAEVMWAGSLSHNGLMACGNDGGDWACHQLEHELGGMFDVAHGAGLAAVWGSWARYVCDALPDRFEQFAVNVMGVENGDDKNAVIQKGIEAMENFFRQIEMPTDLGGLNIEVSEDQMKELALKCSHFGKRTIGCVKKLNQEDIYRIYQKAAD